MNKNRDAELIGILQKQLEDMRCSNYSSKDTDLKQELPEKDDFLCCSDYTSGPEPSMITITVDEYEELRGKSRYCVALSDLKYGLLDIVDMIDDKLSHRNVSTTDYKVWKEITDKLLNKYNSISHKFHMWETTV